MVLRTVNLSDTIDQWKNQHNSLATDVGDLSLLNTPDSSSIVAAINSLIGEFDSANIVTLARASLSQGTGITYSSSTGVITLNIPSSTVTSAMIVDATIVNGDISASAAIVDTKLATIATAGKVSNSATTATSANTASAIVARDASGNFTAGTITTAALDTATTASHYFVETATDGAIRPKTLANVRTEIVTTAAVNAAAATTVGTVTSGTWNASAISDTYLSTISTAGKVSNSATTATSANTLSAIVARDGSGNFTAGTITAALTGNASTATTLATGRNFSLTGEVTAPEISFNGSGAVALSTTIAANAVDSSNILALSVSTAKLQDNSVTFAKMADSSVGSNELRQAVQLIIYNSAGSAVKSLYGAGE